MSDYKHILIKGSARFIGSNLAIYWTKYPNTKITCLDNLHRHGSELSLPRLKKVSIEFAHGDIRNTSDIVHSYAQLVEIQKTLLTLLVFCANV